MTALALYSHRVLINDNLIEATVTIADGKITSVRKGKHENGDFLFRNYGNHVIMPGLIDSHVHINEPGRTTWEGFETATKAAAAGGITTLIDMPLNSTPVTTNRKAFTTKLNAASHKTYVNCGFWGGYIGQDPQDLADLFEEGVFGIKVFLTHSGIDDFPNVTEEDLHRIMPVLNKYDGLLLAHCELESDHAGLGDLDHNPTSYQAYLSSRPKKWEDDAIALMIKLCRQYNVRTHIVHLSSSNSLNQIKSAKASGLPLTVETCPHYLYFNASEIKDGDTLIKCAPPIREKENNGELWQALSSGLIDFVVTDHSPAPASLKRMEEGDFKTAWGGIAGLQFSLSAVWTKAKKKGFEIKDIGQLMSTKIADFLNLDNKGQIKIGYDADIVVWNPEGEYIVNEGLIFHKNKETPYLNQRLSGVVKETFVSGVSVYNKDGIQQTKTDRIILNKSR